MGYKLGSASLAEMKLLLPQMVAIVHRAIEITSQDFSVASGPRTAAQQNALYQQGRTKPGNKVTDKDGYKNKSNHQIGADGYGRAVDLVPYVNGKLLWEWEYIWPVAVAMSTAASELGHKIKWGGNWYDTMNQYPATIAGVKAAVERYKEQHPGPDSIDGPHYEFVA